MAIRKLEEHELYRFQVNRLAQNLLGEIAVMVPHIPFELQSCCDEPVAAKLQEVIGVIDELDKLSNLEKEE